MDYRTEIEELVNAFVSHVSELARRAALEAVSQSLGGSSAKVSGFTLTNGGRRSPESLEAFKAKLLRVITDNPGKRSEEIQAVLGVAKKEIALPLRQLVAEKKVMTKGQRRGMRYFAKGAKVS